MKQDSYNSRINFILEILGVTFEDEPVRLVWSAPINEKYLPQSKVGQLLLSIGLELGQQINASEFMGNKGKCMVQDYSKQVNGAVVIYSVIGDMIISKE